MAARTTITYALEELAGDTCLLQHYSTVDAYLIDRYQISAILLSGASTDPDQYGDPGLGPMRDLIVDEPVPIFGFCGGYQLMMEAHGSLIERIGRLAPGEPKENPDYMSGWKTETGYHPVSISGSHALLEGLGTDPIFRHYHGWEIKDLPPGFVNYASTDISSHQLVINDSSRQVGTQFHPEYFTDEYPAGKRLIQNFFDWAGVSS